jgi:hypothetical protein
MIFEVVTDFMQQIPSKEVFSSSGSSPLRMQSWGGDFLHVFFLNSKKCEQKSHAVRFRDSGKSRKAGKPEVSSLGTCNFTIACPSAESAERDSDRTKEQAGVYKDLVGKEKNT